MAIERTIGEVTRFPGGKKIILLVLLVVVLVGLLFWKPRPEDDGLSPDLVALGDTDLALGKLTQEFELGNVGGDSPVDLDGLASGAEPIPVPPPTARAGFQVGTREVDPERLRAAFLAGDPEYLASIFRDETYLLSGRTFAITLAALLQNDAIEAALLEVFEGTSEPFPLRETAAYSLMARGTEAFADYLVRVVGRPAVASGADQAMSRLVILSFFMDRWALEGTALDRVGGRLMELARAGSMTANVALSFGLSTGAEAQDLLSQVRGFEANPTVSDNLLTFYEVMVREGREEFRPALEQLRSRLLSGT